MIDKPIYPRSLIWAYVTKERKFLAGLLPFTLLHSVISSQSCIARRGRQDHYTFIFIESRDRQRQRSKPIDPYISTLQFVVICQIYLTLPLPTSRSIQPEAQTQPPPTNEKTGSHAYFTSTYHRSSSACMWCCHITLLCITSIDNDNDKLTSTSTGKRNLPTRHRHQPEEIFRIVCA